MTLRTAVSAARIAMLFACMACGSSHRPGDDAEDAAVGSSDAAAPTSAIVALDVANQPCALARDGRLRCWHSDELVTEHEVPGAVDLTVGSASLCALMADGGVRCWTYGDPPGGFDVSVEVTGLGAAVDLDSGGGSTCAVMDDGTVACWGGMDLTARSFRASVVDGLRDVVEVEVGWGFACARRGDDSVWCWELPEAPSPSGLGFSTAPERVSSVDRARRLAVGAQFVCAEEEAGDVECFGPDFEELLGAPLSHRPSAPSAALSAGYGVGCVLAEGALTCWGINPYGQVTGEPSEDPVGPTRVTVMEAPSRVAVGHVSTCAVEWTDEIVCWGYAPLRARID